MEAKNNAASLNGTNRLTPLAPGTATRKKGIPWNDPEFESNFPTLALYLMQDRFDNQALRRTSTLTVYFEERCVVVVLNDRENNRSCFTNGASLFSTLLTLEQSLCDDSADWKIRSSYGGKNTQVPF